MANDFNLEAKLQEQEANQGRVASDAVTKAKENIAQRKLEQQAREVERRLSQAENTETEALKSLRLARKKEEAQKKYLTAISAAKTAFEASGDYQTYDKAVETAEDERDKAINEAKKNIFGNDAWRY